MKGEVDRGGTRKVREGWTDGGREAGRNTINDGRWEEEGQRV